MHTLALDNTLLLACKNCGEILASDNSLTEVPKSPIPSDWSFVQIGSTAEFKKASLKVVGRIRLQLRNEYKNFWCTDAGQGKCLWIVESFGSFAVFNPELETYNGDAKKLRSGASIKFDDTVTLTGEYVEKIEGISYQGELGPWKIFRPGLFMVQASNSGGRTAIYFIESKTDVVRYLTGDKIAPENLKLANILMWNEWK
jgi:hypothetical protein